MDAQAGPRVLAVCGLAFEAAIAAGPGVTVLCGSGPQRFGDRPPNRIEKRIEDRLQDRLQDRIEALLGADAPVRPAGIISFGCAGALDPALAPGSVVLAQAVRCGAELIETDPAWLNALRACLPRARAGVLAGVDAPVVSAADKASLRRDTGACAVDMESHAAALAACRHGLPFAACRVVLDPAWRAIPPCALAGMRADGAAAPLALLAGLARDPRQLAPLCALAREAWLARRALARLRARLGFALALPAPRAPI